MKKIVLPKLKNCPFCKVGKGAYEQNDGDSRHVVCQNPKCRCRTQPQRMTNNMPSYLNRKTWKETEKQIYLYLDRKAGLLWNRRA